MASTVKTAYILTVRRNILTILGRTKRNIKRVCKELEQNLMLERQQVLEEEFIDESEQNRYNEELERSLRVN